VGYKFVTPPNRALPEVDPSALALRERSTVQLS
jgi:hypothetical protein